MILSAGIIDTFSEYRMKRIRELSILTGVTFLLAACSGLIPLRVGPPMGIHIDFTMERIERGKYLAMHVTGCIECHSVRDGAYYSGPLVEGTEGMGGGRFGKEMGIPATVFATNITPYTLGSWTDGEIARAITSGVNRNGEALVPIMPYENYSEMSEEDLFSIIAYLRHLKSIPHNVPSRKLGFPVKIFIRTIPVPYNPRPQPDAADRLSSGEYLTKIAGCGHCHTKRNKLGQLIKSLEFAGGVKYPLPGGGFVTATNITPDQETGIGGWSQEDFIGRFKEFDSIELKKLLVDENHRVSNTNMGWTFYSGLTDEDLGAIYAYLMSLKPIKNKSQNPSP